MAYTEIDDPTEYFSVNTWTADDTTPRSFTGFGHQPDLLWVKHRGSGAIYPTIIDSVRGGDKMSATATDAAEDPKSHGEVTAFGSDGITVEDGTSATYPKLYFNDLDPFGASVGGEYVCWSWKAGTAFSNDASATSIGDIDSSGSVNTDAGFSIVSYTGTGDGNFTVAHGLGSAPKMIILKNRDRAIYWNVYHHTEGKDNFLRLNTSDVSTSSSNLWGTSNPTSTVFGGAGSDASNGYYSGEEIIAYCFAEKQGYSKFGSYTGNGDADGPFVYTGFKPAYVMVKNADAEENWIIFDNKRPGYNLTDALLKPNLVNAESASGVKFDLLSNGFKARVSDAEGNSDGDEFIYMAFAEAPFVNSGGVPANAR